eukprot:NODE_984_length_2554_cov_0.465580.p1 type:complete len:711 gc:universal NODE_984_length_2554_cov_0.465580:172-2304(+)
MNQKFKLPSTLDLKKEYSDAELLNFIPKQSYKPLSKLSAFSNWFVVDGIPIVPDSKKDKLATFFRKYFKSVDECEILVDGDKTTGLMFIKSKVDLTSFNDKLMDKKHVLSVFELLDFFDKPVDLVKDCPATPSVSNELIIFAGNKAIEADIHKLTNIEIQHKNVKLYKHQYTYIQKEYVHVNDKQYKHPNCKDYFISPNQQYLVTWSTTAINSTVDEMPFEYDNKHILIWNLNGYCLKGLESKQLDMIELKLKFTLDDHFMVYNDNNRLTVFNLMANTSSTLDVSTSTFELQPTTKDHKLAYYCKGLQSTPSRVCLVDLDTLSILKSKNLFNVTEAQLKFDPRGIFLLATLSKINKAKKVIGTALELFKLKDRGYPVESMELKSRVTCVEWDPKSSKLVIISVDEQKLQQQRVISSEARREEVSAEDIAIGGVSNNMTIHFMQVQGQCLEELHRLTDTSYNNANYSPAGRIVCLSGVKSLIKGNLAFYDTGASDGLMSTRELIIQKNSIKPKKLVADDAVGTVIQVNIKRDRIVQLAQDVHYRVSKLTWDYSGRYLCTLSVFGTDAGYQIYDLSGNLKLKNTVKHVLDVMWSNPLEIVLEASTIKKIKQNLNSYTSRFEAEDDNAKREMTKGEHDKIESGWADWTSFRKRVREWRLKTKKLRHMQYVQLFGRTGEPTKFEDYYSDTEDLIKDLQSDHDMYGYTEVMTEEN